MKLEEINKVKTQLWNHLQKLAGKIEKLQELGHVIRTEEFVDGLGVRRRGHFLLDQHLFCRSEIKFWKELTS